VIYAPEAAAPCTAPLLPKPIEWRTYAADRGSENLRSWPYLAPTGRTGASVQTP
jgi:hypothetical protein